MILITAPGEFTGDNLTVGKYYNATVTCEGTEKQNRVFHALLQEYWASGCHSYNVTNFEDFREVIKLNLGAGVEEYTRFVTAFGTKRKEPVTDYRIKSWADYSKKERKETIDRLIAEMHQAGVKTKKFYEILETMEINSCKN